MENAGTAAVEDTELKGKALIVNINREPHKGTVPSHNKDIILVFQTILHILDMELSAADTVIGILAEVPVHQK